MSIFANRIARGLAAPVVVALLVAGGCAKGGAPKVRDVLPSAIVVVKDARNVVGKRPQENRNELSVSYTARVPYPATTVLADIRSHLEASGWKPLPMDWFDPRKPSSHKVGWRSHVIQRPDKQYFNWIGQWSTPAGDVVVYFLQYESAPLRSGEKRPAPDNENLRVDVHLMPKRLVPVEALPTALIPLDRARDVSAWRDQSRYRFLEHETGVRYTVKAVYPPSGVMSSIAERLIGLGWVWETDIGSRFSRSPGWSFRPQTRPTEKIFQWLGTWSNGRREQVRYLLSYRSAVLGPRAEPDNDDLDIEARLLSRTEEAGGAKEQPGRPTSRR